MMIRTYLIIISLISSLTLVGCNTEQRFSSFRIPNAAQATSPENPDEDCVANPTPIVAGNLIVEAGTPATLTYRIENNPLWVIWLPEGEQTFIGETISVTIDQVGEYQGVAWGNNNCGQRVDYPFSIVVVPVSLPPVVTLTQTPAATTPETKATFAFTATHSGVGIREFNCSIDGAPANICASPLEYKGLKVGHHTFSVFAIDNKNRQSQNVNYQWEVLRVRVPLTDHFTIDSSGRKLDIVIVDDNSPSMVEEQNKMAARFDKFLEHLNGLDWQLGIITTDASDGKKYFQDGRLVPFVGLKNTYSVNSTTPNLKKVFTSTVVRKEWGSDLEEGIRAILKMLQRPENRFMLRDQSHLATIIISDEDERSNGKNLRSYNTPENLINTFAQLFGATNTFSNHSIVLKSENNSRACKQVGSHKFGATYAKLSGLTGGIVGDICAADYGDILKNIGNDARNKTFTAVLKCEPVGPVDVKFVPQPTTQIQYTLNGNQLTLNPYPPVGTQVAVTYYCD